MSTTKASAIRSEVLALAAAATLLGERMTSLAIVQRVELDALRRVVLELVTMTRWSFDPRAPLLLELLQVARVRAARLEIVPGVELPLRVVG